MWTPCPRALDSTVKFLGLEFPMDYGAVVATFLGLSVFVSTPKSFSIAVALGLGLYFAKRGKPPGALLHTLHSLELWRLGGVLPPTTQVYSPW